MVFELFVTVLDVKEVWIAVKSSFFDRLFQAPDFSPIIIPILFTALTIIYLYNLKDKRPTPNTRK